VLHLQIFGFSWSSRFLWRDHKKTYSYAFGQDAFAPRKNPPSQDVYASWLGAVVFTKKNFCNNFIQVRVIVDQRLARLCFDTIYDILTLSESGAGLQQPEGEELRGWTGAVPNPDD
jgi:hypothetical protein